MPLPKDLSSEKQNQLAEGMTLQDLADKHGVSLDKIQEQFEMGQKVEQEHGDKEQAGRIAMDHLFEDAEYYTKLAQMEKQNSKQFPKVYYARHMESGIAKYSDEVIFIGADTIRHMMPSFVGKPVYVRHDTRTNEDRLEDLQEKADGFISESFYNELDGWFWVKFLAVSDAAHKAIADGWSVSNAYIPTEWGGGGLHHDCQYTRKITGGEFTHLALVPNPRYEMASILSPEQFKEYQENHKRELSELQNSKKEGTKMFKFFKTKKEEVASVDAETMIELEDGSQTTIGELMNAKAKKNESEKEEKEEDKKEEAKENADDQELDVDGEKMTLKELINRYSAMNAKKNEAEAKEKEEKENADDKEDKDEGKDEKQNAAHFEELKNARDNYQAKVQTIETSFDMLARGRARYGSAQ